MKTTQQVQIILKFLFVIFVGSFVIPHSRAQEPSSLPPHIYRPGHQIASDSVKTQEAAEQGYDSLMDDRVKVRVVNQDSIDARMQFVQDSIQARLKFIQDSILAREIFVRDSIARRQRIIDSLNVFVRQLPVLLDASFKAISNEIIFRTGPIHIVGDSTLSDYISYKLTFDFTSPYTPWKSKMNLSTNPPNFEFQELSGRIISISSPQFDCKYGYSRDGKIIIISTKPAVLSKRTGKLYKEPIDSVFLNPQGKVVKVKKYVKFYQVVNNFQRGSALFNHLEEVKQYQYDPGGQLTSFELTKFCDRSRAGDPVKVCNITTYKIEQRGSNYYITRKNNPTNEYSDGTFTYEFTDNVHLSAVAFVNEKGTERWKNIIEVNEQGNVSRYLYDKDGRISTTLLINYFLDDPGAKHKIETITCTFEEDGVSYFQTNNTTGKKRVRDRLTMEWSAWH